MARPRNATLAVVALAVLVAATGWGARTGRQHVIAPPLCGTAVGREPKTYRHVIWILFENRAYDEVVGSPNAPYLNSVARRCGLATNYYAISHPSLPNYLALTSGSTHGITDDADPSAHPIGGPSIFGQLGHAWSSLEESMPQPCALTSSGEYAVKHNPAAYYVSLRAACLMHDVADLTRRPARFTFVTPDLCDDMHDCSTQAGDRWLSRELPRLVSNAGYARGGTAIFIVWDETDSGANHVPLLVVSPYTRAGTRVGARYTHYSLLGTTEAMLGLACLGHACGAGSLRRGFGL